jgi:dipeptidyl aminopeptidase/acylaminoacyl peptidase
VFEFVVVDAASGERKPLAYIDKLAEALAKATSKPVDARRLDLRRLRVRADGGAVWFEFDGKKWFFNESDGLSECPERPEKFGDTLRGWRPSWQAGGRRRGSRNESERFDVVLRDHNLVLRDKQGDSEHVLTTDGTADNGYEQRVYWSPDGKKFVAIQKTKGADRKVYLIESSPADQLQPKLDSYEYLKPGDDIPLRRPRLFDAELGEEIAVDNALFDNPYGIDNVRWAKDSSRFTFYYNQRGHQVARIVAVDAASGEATAIVDEQSDTFIDYAHKRFDDYLDDTNEIVWMSERDGWNHLYLVDATSGTVKHQITRGDWVVREVVSVDAKNRQVWFKAGGVVAGEDPYYLHLCRVDFDGSNFVRLTDGNGTHEVSFSPEGEYIVDSYSRVDSPPVRTLRSAEDGRLVCELETADATRLVAAGWVAPEPFVAKGRDGQTDIYGVIFRPSNFDAKQQYPVIEDIYAGPHGAFVPKSFRVVHGSQEYAEIGFVVVQIDGMGTSYRSKAFHDVACKNLGDSGFADRKLWMQAAAEKYPSLDLSRVGIKGHSAGGQSALRALLAHGDFYDAAVSSCGCHDNRMDKIWWNEAWMGWPVGPHYAEQSNVTNAHKLQGKLLLIVGELDRNVDPASTMQVVDALVKADKDFELLVMPGRGHDTFGNYQTRRTRDFFVRHLLGREPRQGDEK